MKTIITVIFLSLFAYVSSYGQDTSKLKNNKMQTYVKNYGAYTATMYNGKVTLTKNPNFDASKVLKRDTSFRSKWDNGIIEIYTASSEKPTIVKYFIHDLNDVSSEYSMTKKERFAKYNSTKGVNVVHLKKGIVLVRTSDLLKKFNIGGQDADLPLYINYEQPVKQNELLTVPSAVLKIDVIKDADGFRFLNVVTKAWDTERQNNSGKTTIQIR